MKAALVATALFLMAAPLLAAATPASAAPASVAGPAPTQQTRDLEARDLFLSGRYAAALTIYAQLYAETHHPTYLRNIGRCHQMLREPDPAIASFRGYLRDAPALAPSERAEIEGYLTEMERLKLTSPPASGGSPPGPTGGSPAGAPATAAAPAPSTEPAGPGAPITRRWWFWTGIGALAVAGIITAVAAGGGSERLPCPTGAVCPP
jgi:hypothetical protein